jgi:hypothetical protein
MTLSQPHYQVERTPPTWGSAVLYSLLLATATPSLPLPALAVTPMALDLNSYRLSRSIGTYSQLQNMFTGMYDTYSLDFEAALSSFYASLLAKQEPLGREFEKILYENLWDLYIS